MSRVKFWNRRKFLNGASSSVAVASFIGAQASYGASEKKPNILFIMADDLGYADLSCYGRRDFETPELDRLASQGVQLMHCYSSSPVCSATRVALITGRYQYRLDYGLAEPGGQDPAKGLPADHPTLPSLLRNAGYRTVLIGKWHLGGPPEFGPLKSGYDDFYGMYGGADYFYHRPETASRRDGVLTDYDKPALDEGYMTGLLADRAIKEIENSKTDAKPFFISLHFTAPHWPWEGPDDDDVPSRLSSLFHFDGGNIGVYGEMVKSLDKNVGRVLKALAANGLEDNTIVVFTSDNGGERFSDMWPFTGVKGELLEGGIRVPGIVRWPGRIPAGQRSDQPIASMDWAATLVAAGGGAPAPAYPFDGEDLLAELMANRAKHRTLFWRFKANDQAAVRSGDWKYLKLGGREHLFNLAEDQRERADLKDARPEIFTQLKDRFREWNEKMLPYAQDSYSHDVTQGNYSDRY